VLYELIRKTEVRTAKALLLIHASAFETITVIGVIRWRGELVTYQISHGAKILSFEWRIENGWH